jgi:photosystem II stability/assembly factor-like uncharacterized protein
MTGDSETRSSDEQLDKLLGNAYESALGLGWNLGVDDVLGASGRPRGSRVRNRFGVVLVAAAILVVFFVPLPHLSVFDRLSRQPSTSPGPSTTTTTRPTRTTLPASSITVESVIPVGATDVWAEWYSGGGYPASPQGVQRSSTAGRTWTDATPSNLKVVTKDNSISDFFALDADHAWITYGSVNYESPQTIVATSDGGHDWQIVGRIPNYGCSLQFVTVNDGWCSIMGGEMGQSDVWIYRTVDGGRHWRLVSVGSVQRHTPGALPTNCDKTVGFVSPKIGWAVPYCNVGFGPLYETTDGGGTWKATKIEVPSFTFYVGGFLGVPVLQGRSGAVGCSFAGRTSTHIIVYVTANAGASWHEVVPPGPARGWAVDIITPSHWRLVSGKVILGTDNAGRSWRTIRSNIGNLNPGFAVARPGETLGGFVNDDVGWMFSGGVGSNLALWRTIDGGVIWNHVAVPGV